MTKTKTKRTIYTILALVAIFGSAAFFYFWKYPLKQADTLKEVPVVESVESKDATPTTKTISGPREYISEYLKEKDRFNAIGVSWEEVSAKDGDIKFYIRVKNKGTETEWFEVYKSFAKKEGTRNFYNAETPILVRGDEYQYKITFKVGDSSVENIKFRVINTMGSATTRFIDKLTGIFKKQVVAASWSPGNIIPRSQWGGSTVNATATLWPPQYAKKSTKFVVHHTAGANYTCELPLNDPNYYAQADAQADVKAIWQDHTYGNEWGDIGYNYLVDPCGRVFEGRMGGNNVIAGHASPYNYWDKTASDGKIDEASIGVSVMGNHVNLVPSEATFESLGRIIGYKSYINGINPLTSSVFKDKNTFNIAGHIDYWATACPGSELYTRLSSVRSAANSHKKLYLADYGDYETTAQKIILNTARVSMENATTTTAGDFVLAKNPAIGEPITMISSLKNTNTKSVILESVKVIGILDNGTEFIFGQTPTMTIGAGQIGAIPTAEYNITSFRYQSYKITYELHLAGPTGSEIIVEKEPTISTSYSYPSIVPHFPNVKITSGPVSNPSNPILNVPAAISYTVKNYDGRPAYLRNYYVKTVSGKSIIKTRSLNPSKVDPAKSYTYSDVETFGILGKVVLTPFYTYGNGTEIQGTNIENKVVSSTVNVLSESANYSKISLNSFKATMENTTTPSDANDFVLASKPAIGEPITIRSSLKNANNYEVTLSNVRIRGRLDSGTEFTVGTVTSIVIPANTVMAVTAKTFNITSSRIHSFYLDFQADGKTLRPTVSASYSYQQILAHFPNVKIVKTPVSTPTTPLIKSAVTVTYKLKNYDLRPAYIKDITILAKLDNKIPYYFPKETRKFMPGEVYQYSRAIIPANGGMYYSIAQVTYGNGTTTNPAPLSAYKNTVNFKVYTETATLNGYTIPSTYGKVAREQHLYLNRAEYLLNRTWQSTALHYTNSSTPSAVRVKANSTDKQNDMAGGSGGFGGYFDCSPMSVSCNMPIADERYYINMRWSYVTWYEAADGTCSAPLDGHLDTCTRNYNSTSQAWHKQKRVVVTNPANGKKIVASVLESGPAIWVGRVAGLSPEAMYALGASTNNYLKYYWAADQTMPLGPIN